MRHLLGNFSLKMTRCTSSEQEVRPGSPGVIQLRKRRPSLVLLKEIISRSSRKHSTS